MANTDRQRTSIKEESFADTFFKYLYIVLKYKLLILIVALIVAPATFIILKMREPEFTPLYKTTARLRIVTGLEAMSEEEIRDQNGAMQLLKIRVEGVAMLMRSSVVLENVVKKVYNLGENDKNKIDFLVKNLQGPEVSETGVPGIIPEGDLRVRRELNYINITVIDSSPQIALEIVENLIVYTKAEILNSQKQTVKETLTSLERELEETRRDLEESKIKLTKFIVENKVVSKMMQVAKEAMEKEKGEGGRTPFFASDTDFLAIELVRTRSEITIKEDFLKDVERRRKRGSPGDIEAYRLLRRKREELTYPGLMDSYSEAYARVQKLLLSKKEAHPDVIKAKEELGDAMKNISRTVDSIIETLKREIGTLKSEEKDITTIINQGLSNVMVKYSHLKRNVMIKQQLAEKVLDSVQKLSLISKLITSIRLFTVTDAPTLPKQPFNLYQKTRTFINYLLFSLILGAGAGISAGILVDYLAMAVRDIVEIEDTLDFPILGEIPVYEEAIIKGTERYYLPLQKKPASTTSEAFRGLRTNIKFRTMGKEANTFLITSFVPKEGKTFITANLAAAFAQTDKKVLVIDCDLRKPVLHKYFNLENKKGITQLIKGELDIKPTPVTIPNLSVIVAGGHSQNPAELLSSETFDKTLERLKQGFDLVLIDSPPLFAVADATILMRKSGVDNAILIFRANVTPKKALRRAAKALEDIKEKIVGIVFNGIEIQRGRYGSYYYYQYDYYGKKRREDKKTA